MTAPSSRTWMAIVIAMTAVGCPKREVSRTAVLADPIAGEGGSIIAAMNAELQDDVLSSYERDEPPDFDTPMIPAEIGGGRIGVGPGDVLVAGELERAPSRWPLRIDRETPSEIRSKRLEPHLASDLSSAWVADELSWRITVCGRTAVIPLRITMLYARDGDRWVQVFEHMSFGHTAAPRPSGELYGARIPSKTTASSDFVDELSAAASPLLSHAANRAAALASGPEAMLLGPDVYAEWHGDAVLGARLVPGPARKIEDRRIGYVGRSLASATVAYWIGNVVASLPARPGVAAGKVRLRTTFVFERRRFVKHEVAAAGGDEAARLRAEGARRRLESQSCAEDATGCRWVIVQAHVSQPISDQELATRVFGTSLLSSNLESGEPLRVGCDDKPRATTR